MNNSPKYRIALIGSGNTAVVLARFLTKAGHRICTVWSRTPEKGRELAVELNAVMVDSPDMISPDHDICLIAVSDQAIGQVAARLPRHNWLLLHTAGSVGIDAVSFYADASGVLYPLQTLRKEWPVHTEIPFLIDGNTSGALARVRELALTISSKVVQANDQQREAMHLAAVMVSNFTNHLYQVAYDWCQSKGLSFDMLIPLVKEMALRQNGQAPGLSQTGPASRGDLATIERHMRSLEDHPFGRELYQLFSQDIIARYEKKEELRPNSSKS